MKTQKRKEKLIHAIAALVMAITLSSCVTMGMSSSRVQMTGRIHQGQTYQEVTSIMKKGPNYRRFTEDGLEQWEYHKNFDLAGNYDVILIGFRDGRVVSMDSFRYTPPTIEVNKQ